MPISHFIYPYNPVKNSIYHLPPDVLDKRAIANFVRLLTAEVLTSSNNVHRWDI
jgi:hypothetical protein